MKIFRYRKMLPLDTPFHSEYSLIPETEITSKEHLFEWIVEAIKKTDCQWVMLDQQDIVVETSDNFVPAPTWQRSGAPIVAQKKSA